MRKRWVYNIQLILSLVIITALVVGCASSPSTSTPDSVTAPSSKSTPTLPASEYPADISGHVIIADKVIVQGRTKKIEEKPFGNDAVWWIVEVSVKNKDYDYPIKSIWDKSISMPKGITDNIIWSIIIDGKLFSGLGNLSLFVPPSMSISKGQSGKTTFLFESRNNINPGDAMIRYAGEEPFSYGKLTGGDKMAVYDWDLKKAMQAGALTLQPVEGTRTNREVFQYPSKVDYAGRYDILSADLKVVQEWHGTESTIIKYTPEKSPWVLNAYYNPTSKIQSSLFVSMVPSKAIGKSLEGIEYPKSVRLIDIITITSPFNEVGKYKYGLLMATYEPMEIKVEASGCEWTIKIGVE